MISKTVGNEFDGLAIMALTGVIILLTHLHGEMPAPTYQVDLQGSDLMVTIMSPGVQRSVAEMAAAQEALNAIVRMVQKPYNVVLRVQNS